MVNGTMPRVQEDSHTVTQIDERMPVQGTIVEESDQYQSEYDRYMAEQREYR